MILLGHLKLQFATYMWRLAGLLSFKNILDKGQGFKGRAGSVLAGLLRGQVGRGTVITAFPWNVLASLLPLAPLDCDRFGHLFIILNHRPGKLKFSSLDL